MKKKILSLALALVLITALLPVPALAAVELNLDSAGSWAHEAIESGFNSGWLYTTMNIDQILIDNDYRRPITRGEFAILIYRWIEKQTNIHFELDRLTREVGKNEEHQKTLDWLYSMPPFSTGYWSADENLNPIWVSTTDLSIFAIESLSVAIRIGIISKDDLNDPITREQAATIIMRGVNAVNVINERTANGQSLFDTESEVKAFVDAPQADFADIDQVSSEEKDGVNFVSANGIMGDIGNNRFDPRGLVTVERAIVSINNIDIDKINNMNSASTWAREGITAALDKGFVPADIQDNYKNDITRQEFCRMAVKWVEYATGKNIDTILTEQGKTRNPNAFNDTSDPDILAAFALGITSGTSAPTATTPGTFTPNGEFSREQAATMIMNTCRAIGANVSNPPASDFVDLNTAATWARDGINYVRANGIMSGTSTDPTKPAFSPSATYTREQSIMTFNNINHNTLPGR